MVFDSLKVFILFISFNPHKTPGRMKDLKDYTLHLTNWKVERLSGLSKVNLTI